MSAGIPITTLQRMAADGDRQASSMLARFEQRYERLVRERREVVEATRVAIAPSRPLRSKGEGVNGKEIRAGERWQASRVRRFGPARGISTDPVVLSESGSNVAVVVALIGGQRWQEIVSPAVSERQAAREGERPEGETDAQAQAREARERLIAAATTRGQHDYNEG